MTAVTDSQSRHDALAARLEELEAENERLRSLLVEAGRALQVAASYLPDLMQCRLSGVRRRMTEALGECHTER